MDKQKRSQPLWETLVLAGSFLLLWIWFLVRQNAYKTPGAEMSPLWQVALGIAAIALIVITVRRVARVKRALQENMGPNLGRNAPPFPMLDGERHGAPDESKRRHPPA